LEQNQKGIRKMFADSEDEELDSFRERRKVLARVLDPGCQDLSLATTVVDPVYERETTGKSRTYAPDLEYILFDKDYAFMRLLANLKIPVRLMERARMMRYAARDEYENDDEMVHLLKQLSYPYMWVRGPVTSAARELQNANLVAAAKHNQVSAIRDALQRGADPDVRDPETGLTPLATIARIPDRQYASWVLLLSAGADINADNGSVLSSSIHSGLVRNVEITLMFGAHAHLRMGYKLELEAFARIDDDKMKIASSMRNLLRMYDVCTRRLAKLLKPHVMRRVQRTS